MHLKIKKGDFEIEALNVDSETFERVLVSVMNHIEGKSFSNTYGSVKKRQQGIEEQPVVKSSKEGKGNYIKPIDGVRTFPDGRQEYQCSYKCTCGHSGIRYIADDDISGKTKCHKCNTELAVIPATLNDAHDEDFNYFLAM